MKTEEFEFLGHKCTVIIPDKPNGKWVWKAEFLYAFDKAERELLDMGYTRVYFDVSNRYGSPEAVRLMHAFHLFLIEKYGLQKKANLFGFSRGALYAFNYALFYPEYVDKIYLDAPVLNLKSWPQPKVHLKERAEMLKEYRLTEETVNLFNFSPIDFLDEFARLNIPLLIVAGGADTVVHFNENSEILVDYYKEHSLPLEFILKPDCDHHPHSLDDVSPIINFITK